MHVEIKRIDKTLPLPEYKTAGAVAFDILAREAVTIEPHSLGRIPGNIIVKIPAGYMLFIKERSSSAPKKGLFCTAGIIDQDYCGDGDELILQMFNFRSEPVLVERGERLAQGVFLKMDRADWEEVETMGAKTRGGFGTTGTHL